MQRPAKRFEEYYEVCPASDDEPCESGTKVVKRQPQFSDDLQLPQYFFNTTGKLAACVLALVIPPQRCICKVLGVLPCAIFGVVLGTPRAVVAT